MKLTKAEQKLYLVCPGCNLGTRNLVRFELHLREHGSIFREKKWKDLVSYEPRPASKKK